MSSFVSFPDHYTKGHVSKSCQCFSCMAVKVCFQCQCMLTMGYITRRCQLGKLFQRRELSPYLNNYAKQNCFLNYWSQIFQHLQLFIGPRGLIYGSKCLELIFWIYYRKAHVKNYDNPSIVKISPQIFTVGFTLRFDYRKYLRWYHRKKLR